MPKTVWSQRRASRLGSHLVHQFRSGGLTDPSDGGPTPRPGRTTTLPLGRSQEGIWLTEQLQPGASLNIEAFCAWARGPLDGPALEAALSDLIERHEALRTAITTVDGAPAQTVLAEAGPMLRVVEVHGEPPRALELAAQAAQEPFDLDQPPLAKVWRYRVSDELSLLLITAHHAVCDGWSLGASRSFSRSSATRAPARPLLR